MKSFQTYLVAVLVLTTITASAIAWKQYRELVDLRAAAMSPEERSDLQKRVWDAQKRAEKAEAEAAAIHRSVADSLGTPAAAGEDASGDQQSRVITNMVNTWIGMMNDPEAQRLMALQQKAGISSRYADLFRRLKLPPDKLEQFKAELLEKQTSRNDALLAAAQQGINPMQNPKEFQQLQDRIQSDIDQQIKATIGDSAFQDYKNYQGSQGPRSVISQLRQSLSYTETPLTPPQAEQMTQILATTGPQKPGPDGAPVANDNNTRVTDETMTQAQTVLAPPQVRALQEIQQQQRAGEQLQKLMRESRNNSPTGPMGGAPGGG